MNSIGAHVSQVSNGISLIKYTGVSIMHTPHIHAGYELYFCPESIPQRAVISGVSYEYSCPAVIISKPYTIHSMSCLPECQTEYERYVFYFDKERVVPMGDFSELIFGDTMGVLLLLDKQDATYLAALINAAQSSDVPLDESELSLLLSLLLNRIYAISYKEKIIKVGASDSYMSCALQYITENFSENLTSEIIAKRFSVSPSKLERDFKSAIGMTSHAFLTSCRIGEAEKLLAMGKYTVAEACAVLGFASETYFYRFLKKHLGKSPGEFEIKK